MVKIFFLFPAIFFCSIAFGQVGIGTNNPLANTVLDITHDSKGLLVPRINMINDSTPIRGTKPLGLLIWNSNAAFQNGVGFYYWGGTLWRSFFVTINTLNSNGVVLAPTIQNRNSAWSTDHSGNPRWKRTNRTMEYINNF